MGTGSVARLWLQAVSFCPKPEGRTSFWNKRATRFNVVADVSREYYILQRTKLFSRAYPQRAADVKVVGCWQQTVRAKRGGRMEKTGHVSAAEVSSARARQGVGAPWCPAVGDGEGTHGPSRHGLLFSVEQK